MPSSIHRLSELGKNLEQKIKKRFKAKYELDKVWLKRTIKRHVYFSIKCIFVK